MIYQLNKLNVKRIGYLSEERGLYKKMKVGEQSVYLAVMKGLTHHVGSYGVWRTVSRSIIVGVFIDSYDCMYYWVIGNNLQVYNFIYR